MRMEAKSLDIPLESIIKNLENELELLTEKLEELCDKGQVSYHISQKISEKRSELEAMMEFKSRRSSNIFIV